MSVSISEVDLPGSDESFDRISTVIFDRIFVLFGVLDPAGHIVDLRGRIFNETSAKPELLVRQPFAETVFWQTSEGNVRFIERAIEAARTGTETKLVLDFRLSADEKRPLELNFQPIDAADGQSRIFVYAQSTEDQSRSLEAYKNESEQLLLAAEISGLGLWYWDHLTQRVYSTPRCNEIFALAPYEEMNFEKMLAIVHPDDRDFVVRFFQETRRRGSRYSEEFRVVYADRSVEWIRAEGKSYLNSNGDPEKMVGVISRITDQKNAAAELERVYTLAKKARDEAEIANRSKDFFLAFVSHEMRSSLNTIAGYSRILLRGPVDEATQRKAYEAIASSAAAQTKLINDLVDSARVASGKIKLEYRQVNIVNIVRSTVEGQRLSADNHGLEYTFSAEKDKVIVFGDAIRLQQVFDNLLSNAIKFTPRGGGVAVTVAPHDSTVEITITDTGRGIDPQAITGIFKQFAQGDAERSLSSGGLGLGLSIVNILVTKHGGSVRAESEGRGLGSRFIVTLPVNANAQDIEVAQRSANPSMASADARKLVGMDILVVEDDPDSREVLQLFLQQNGATVRTAESARDGMAMLTDPGTKLPDVVISDLAMPDEDGYTFISKIRELPPEKGGHIPAVALSAFASAESRQRAFEAGFHRYLTKPFEPDLTVDQLIALKSLIEENEQN